MSTTATMTATAPPVQDAGIQLKASAPTTEHVEHIQHGQATRAFVKLPEIPTFTDKYEERAYQKGRLALAFRILDRHNMSEGVAGHITLCDPVKPDHFWVNPFGLPFKYMRSSDLILVDPNGNVVDGGENRMLNTAGYLIHHAVHTARPDVNFAVHSHSRYGRTWCAFGRPVDMLVQDSCVFYKDQAVYTQFNGAVLAEEEGKHIAEALGPNKICLMQNHGLLAVGETIEAAIHWFMAMDGACHTQLMVEAARSEPILIDDEDAEFTYKIAGHPQSGWYQGRVHFVVEERESKGEHLE